MYIVNSAGGIFCWNYETDTFLAIMQVTSSVAIMQVLRLYCSHAGGSFYYRYVGESFC